MTATGDLFTPIHKALRSMIYSLSERLQTNDFADVAVTKALVTDLENDFAIARSAGCMLCVLSQHAVDEESVIFPPVVRAGNGLIAQLIEEHHDLARRELALAKEAHQLLAMESGDRRIDAGIRLNLEANQLFAAYIAHMNREEVELVPLMRKHFTDEQLVAMRSTIMGQMPPDRMFFVLGWMLPSLNVAELSGLLSSFRQGAPPQLMKAVTDLCAAKVEPARWSEVKIRVGL
jgi:Hemerythrin HHE cation binding domain